MTLGKDPEEAGFGSSRDPSEGPGGDPCGCDGVRVFELADGSLDPEEAGVARRHLESCRACQELYEKEVGLSSCLRSSDFFEGRPAPCSVHRGVAMALPTRSLVARFLWASLAGALLIVVLSQLETNDTGPELLAMSVLAACWGFVSGAADVLRAVFAAAGPTILWILALGGMVDLLIALAYVFATRRRRARQA